MRITPFAGLTVLEPGEPFSTDGYSFQDRNPDLTDRLLRVGAVTHRHDEHAALGDPGIAPSGSALASGGSFPAAADAVFGYTLVDAYGGESLISPLAEVTTAGQIPAPDAPTGSADYAAGGLLSGIYSYVRTWTDGAGGETEASFETAVAIDPGHASGRVRFTGLSSGMTAASATGWRLYKSANGSDFHFIAAGSGATLDDAGQLCADCVERPPLDNTTQNHNLVQLQMPGSGTLPSAAVSFRLYGSVDVGFTSPAFFGQYPRASGGATFNFASFNPGDGSPPPISTTVPGASKINPDTEILGNHWKQPVANSGALPASGNSNGDVRLTLSDYRPWTWQASAWVAWASGASGGGGGGGGDLVWDDIDAVGTLSAGWSNTQTFGDVGAADWAYAGIAKDVNNVVHMRGMLTKSSALSLPENIARLPVGFRPPFRKRFSIPAYDPLVGHPFMLLVDIAGVLDTGNAGRISLRWVMPYDDSAAGAGNGPQITFDGISFETEI